MSFRKCQSYGLVLGALVWAFQAEALINPNFTPVNLVDESQQIIMVTLKKGAQAATFEGVTQTALKGEKLAKMPVLDCNKALNEETKKYLVDFIDRVGSSPALLFMGKFSETGEAGQAPQEDDRAGQKMFLHIGAKWVDLVGEADGTTYGLIMLNAHMEGTWAGSSDMLLRAVKFRLADPTADFPVKSGASWQAPVQIGKVDGLRKLRAVDLDGNGKGILFAMSDKGDKLFVYDAASKTVKDVTAARKLTSKSVAVAWGDFSGDGKLDLASFDGKVLTVLVQKEDGTFLAQPVALAAEAAAGCSVLAALDVGQKDKAGLLIAGGASPLMLKDVVAAAPLAVPLAEGGTGAAGLGKMADCLVADLDNDQVADVLCVYEKGSLLFKGKSAGAFMPAAKGDISGGTASQAACLADFDSDGRLDVFTVSEEGSRIWQNEGGGKFAEYLNVSGEIAYISKPNSIDCMTSDFNNDGRQDVLITYSDQGAQIFFNRGFRSFGHAHDLDLTENQLLVAAEAGQKAGCAIDLNNDGAQDMVLGLPDGGIWCFDRSTDDGQPLAVIAALSPKHPFKGPVTVTGWVGERLLGAWNVMPGTADAFFGTREAGVITVKWQLPGNGAQKMDVQLESKAKRIELK
jgi:hypothetical protein